MAPSVQLRPMRKGDLPAVMAIERMAYSHPWTASILEDCLRMQNYACWVGLIDGKIAGYGILSIAAGECHLLNLCVHPDQQGNGLGRILLRHLLALARRRGADTAFLEVRSSNRIARKLYASEGFCEIGRRRGYYPHPQGREDAILMARALLPVLEFEEIPS